VVESGDRIGSVTLDFLVPDEKERLSTPILSDQLISSAGDRRVLPIVHRSFAAGGTLQCWIELYGAAEDPGTLQQRATASFAARSAAGREWALGAATSMATEFGKPTRLVSIPLAQAEPGDNELVLIVRDEVKGRVFEARERFHVEPAKPPSSDEQKR